MKPFGDYKSGSMKKLQDKCAELGVVGYTNDACGQNVIDLECPAGFVFAEKLYDQVEDLDPAYSKVIRKRFWDMI